MKVNYSMPTIDDIQSFEESGFAPSVLIGRIKIIVSDEDGNTGETFMEKDQIEKLGKDYISSHAKLEYSSFCDMFFVRISENDFYNDPVRNPPKIIPLDFEGTEGRREIYRGKETGRIYIRENYYPREHFAKWYICGKRRAVDEGDEPRANLIFEYNGQREKVRYDDWNGVAAYSDTFNSYFNSEV